MFAQCAHTQTYTQKKTHTHIETHTHTHINSHEHTVSHKHTYILTHTNIHTHTLRYRLRLRLIQIHPDKDTHTDRTSQTLTNSQPNRHSQTHKNTHKNRDPQTHPWTLHKNTQSLICLREDKDEIENFKILHCNYVHFTGSLQVEVFSWCKFKIPLDWVDDIGGFIFPNIRLAIFIAMVFMKKNAKTPWIHDDFSWGQ